MTKELQDAWQTSSAPFHDETVYSEDGVPIGVFPDFIRSVLRHIDLYYPGKALLTFDDWHEHDGILLRPKPVSMEELVAPLETPASLCEWGIMDDWVCRAIYPENLGFLLRIRVLEEDGEPEENRGMISFTGYGFDLMEIEKRAADYEEIRLKRVNSKGYFDSIYAG